MRRLDSRVTARARSREDRAGDPLDGLVNLFDIGIVLSVAFLLAALSSLDLTSILTDPNQSLDRPAKAPPDAVVAEEQDTVEAVELEPGERVVGRGEEVGTVYQLEDGRTIIVRPGDQPPGGGATAPGGSESPVP